VTCRACEAEFDIELNPPDAPGTAGRIDVIREGRHARDDSAEGSTGVNADDILES
jgi:hypothetical protein